MAVFDREARRKIRRGTEAGYEFRAEDSADALAKAWPLYQDCARRKHFRLERPLSFFIRSHAQGSALTIVPVFIRCISTEKWWEARWYFVTARPRTASWRPSTSITGIGSVPALALHARYVSLGSEQLQHGSGAGFARPFQKQFCECPVSYPGALTIVLKERLLQAVEKGIFPMAKTTASLRKIAFQRATLSR